MALKSNREGLRKELVDYLGNLIINEKLKEDIFNSIDSFIKVDLLWTNANPNGTFIKQTINLDLNNYQAIFIEVNYKTSSVNLITGFLFRKGSKGLVLMCDYDDEIGYRFIELKESGILIGVGVVGINTSAINNDYIIPVRIYGVR